MKKVDLKQIARSIKWTTEHTLTDNQRQQRMIDKLARAEQFIKLNRASVVKSKA